MMLGRGFPLLGVLFLCSMSLAAEWEIPAQEIQEIQFRGRAAKLMVQRAKGAAIRVSIVSPDEIDWEKKVVNNTLSIAGPENRGSVDDTKITVEIPQSVTRSDFVFEDVRADIYSVSRLMLTTLKGKISGFSTGEGVRYFMQKGEIQSFEHTGGLEIESYGGKVMINDGQAALKIRLFSGELAINKNQGPLNLESQNVQAKINGQQGNTNLQWGKGNLSLMEFAGRLEGLSRDGQLQLQLKPDAMVDLQAERGKVSINLPSDSGASVNLRTVGGGISVPGPLRAGREGRFRVAKGKLPGSAKGNIIVRGEDASLVIK